MYQYYMMTVIRIRIRIRGRRAKGLRPRRVCRTYVGQSKHPECESLQLMIGQRRRTLTILLALHRTLG